MEGAVRETLAGDSAHATRLADDCAIQPFTDDHAAVLLRGNDAGKAIEVLAAAAPYELGGVVETFHFILYPVYRRGKAYLAKKQGASAAAELQKILDHSVVVRTEPIGALARLELGRAFVMSGDKTKVKTAYEEFLTLWNELFACLDPACDNWHGHSLITCDH